MNIIHPEHFKQHLIKKLNYFYIFLGQDLFLLNTNQNLIINFSHQKGFLETVIINIEKTKDWDKVFNFYKKRNLFSKKNILVIDLNIKVFNKDSTKNIQKLIYLLNSDILIILKTNHLSYSVQKHKFLEVLKKYGHIVSCFTPYNLNFINWIKYEICEKNIKMEEKAFLLLCKYYEGDTFFINKILNMISIIWPDLYIKKEDIKKIISDFFSFLPSHWIDATFQGHKKKAIHILNEFYKKKYNPLILIRCLQKDLLILIFIKREKIININLFLQKNNIRKTRYKFFRKILKNINDKIFLQSIQILLKMEIKIKKHYSNSIWIELCQLTLILC